MSGVKSVQFSLHQGREVKLQHFLSRTLFGTLMSGVKSVQFSLHQGWEVKLQHFLSRTLFGTLYAWGRERTVFLTSLRRITHVAEKLL